MHVCFGPGTGSLLLALFVQRDRRIHIQMPGLQHISFTSRNNRKNQWFCVHHHSDHGSPYGWLFRLPRGKNILWPLTTTPTKEKAENAVKTAKCIMLIALETKTDHFFWFLDIRNRRIWNIPSAETLWSTNKDPPTYRWQTFILGWYWKNRQLLGYKNGSIALQLLKNGDTIYIEPNHKRWTQATVKGQACVRSYQLTKWDGREYRRIRRHLRLTAETTRPPPRWMRHELDLLL